MNRVANDIDASKTRVAPKRVQKNKVRNAARRIIPFFVIAPATALGTMQAVDYVSAPTHLYPTLLSAASKAQAARARAANNSLANITRQINATAESLALISKQASTNQSGVSQIQSGISSIQNTPVPQLGSLANPSSGTSGVSSKSGGTPSGQTTSPPSAASASNPVVVVPVQQAPAATTRASQLG